MPGQIGIVGLGRGVLENTLNARGMAVSFPLKASSNNRYLVDQKGTPVPIFCDTPWAAVTTLSATDCATYIRTRSAQGFNAAFLGLIDNAINAGSAASSTWGPNANGDLPFTTKQGGGAYTNSQTQSPDFSTPNSAYWNFALAQVQQFANAGWTIFLYPFWIGNPIGDPGSEGFYNALSAQSSGIRQGYGAFVGTTFKSIPNIVWLMGGDNTMANGANIEAICNDIRTGITSTWTSFTPLFSFDGLDGNDLMADWAATATGNGWINPNNVYTDEPNAHPWVYVSCKTAYQTYSKPFYFKEGRFEDGSETKQFLRSQTYQAMLGGACGYTFGNTPLWTFQSGWPDSLSSRGSLDCQVANKFFLGRAWNLLVPDWGNTFLTNGASYINATFASAAQASDGSWGAVYVPTNESLTVALSGFRGQVSAQWMDPTSGVLSTASGSPFANSGSHTFAATPGTNAQGDADWLLVFTA